MRWRALVVTGLIGLFAGLGGAWLGLWFFDQTPEPTSVHAAIHRTLELTSDQNARLEAIEARFSARRAALEQDMRDANRELAIAIDEDKDYTPRVQTAVDHFHHAMGELQKATVEHVFEMRAVLSSEQQVTFDATVKAALLRSADGSERN
jgi:Spy/CpxP family protein refolding chaperone